MNLEMFKRINGKKKPQQKLFKFAETMEIIGDCRVHRAEAKAGRNEEEAEYYERERTAHEKRAEWLYSELWNYLVECENEKTRLENDWR